MCCSGWYRCGQCCYVGCWCAVVGGIDVVSVVKLGAGVL